jgi:hypothetical protein
MLLAKRQTWRRHPKAVELLEFVRIRKRLERCSELLGRDEVEVLDVVSVLSVRVSSAWTFCYRGETIPSNTFCINTRFIRNIKNAVVNTSFVKSFAYLIPNKLGHLSFLLEEKFEDIMIQIIGGIETIVYT